MIQTITQILWVAGMCAYCLLGQASSGMDDLAANMGQSFAQSIHALISNLRTPFYAGEVIFLVLTIKQNPKLALGGSGAAAMLYEFAISLSGASH